ncbi:hypothetical protein KHP60_23220 [Microvirga sp. 3-52]|uniref:hypothetical protein n=1 Tax=Microvirga sp. 3-52 TaxID=2792425 RepID=UPI001AD20433|nr:hypothetical protein [Microvirga sp. 3-52]MBO1908879.1 hypothetical protein [Microvirga sp. 3-52]MBS7455209.1 hypothetical protein [Microvirga sp. 3-52]
MPPPPPGVLADYAEVPGNIISRLPIIALNGVLRAFLLPSSMSTLQAACDKVLNNPSGGALTFMPALPLVLFTDLFVPRMTSGDPVDSQKGFVKEQDLGFWILTIGGLTDAPLDWRLRWLPVYLWVDSGAAMAGGREVFGYPKHLGHFVRSGAGNSDVSVSSLHFQSFGPTIEGVEEVLVQFTSGHVLQNVVGNKVDLDPIIASLFASFLGTGLPPPLNGLTSLIGDITLPYLGMPMVFLKQFRDAHALHKSCFTAVAKTVVSATALHQAGLLSGTGQIVLTPSASHPIAGDLGLSAVSSVGDGVFVKLDFSVGPGETIWQA